MKAKLEHLAPFSRVGKTEIRRGSKPPFPSKKKKKEKVSLNSIILKLSLLLMFPVLNDLT